METSDNSLADPSNLGRNSRTGKGHRSSKDKAVATANELRNTDKSKEMGVNGNLSVNGLIKFDLWVREGTETDISQCSNTLQFYEMSIQEQEGSTRSQVCWHSITVAENFSAEICCDPYVH
ncbi:hypothetical protein NC651_011848 [Populus alba x Populus x berolinensis]|nr:hypothetical protein NC651_011848 [Populus alba x Populus x berolinensis]